MLSSFNVQSIIAAVLVFLLFYSPTHSTLRWPRTPPHPSPLAVLGGVFQSLTLSHMFPHPRCLSHSLDIVLVVFVAAKSTKTGLLSQANSVKYLSNVKVHPVRWVWVWAWVYSLCTRYIPLWFLAFPLPQFPQFCRLSVCLLPCLVGIIKGNFLYIQ